MNITVKRIVDWSVAMDSALFTVNKNKQGTQPTDTWIAKACKAEHSMLRDVRYIVEMNGIPSWVSQHFARHDAFATHTVRDSGETHFVSTLRSDRTGIDRNKLTQDAPVNHRISLSAQDFITISKLRLCNMASTETRAVWKAVIAELAKIDPVLAAHCVPTCVYRGYCPEFTKCGYTSSNRYVEQLNKYRTYYGARSN